MQTKAVDGVQEKMEIESGKVSNFGANIKSKISKQSEKFSDRKKKKLESDEEVDFEKANCISFTNWFFTFLIQDIPIIGEIALIFWACSKRNAVGKRQYAIARLIYKLIFDAIAIAILIGMFMVARHFIDMLIQYMEML